MPLPAKSGRATIFNQIVGLDVKYLPGWKPNQKVKSLNIVDQNSCFQQVIPFFEQEISMLLRNLFEEHWMRWAGPPTEVIMDQAQTMLGDHIQQLLALNGSHVKWIPAEAHWQLGRTESHGGWFTRVLSKILDEHQPIKQESWLQCVKYAHVKNQMI